MSNFTIPRMNESTTLRSPPKKIGRNLKKIGLCFNNLRPFFIGLLIPVFNPSFGGRFSSVTPVGEADAHGYPRLNLSDGRSEISSWGLLGRDSCELEEPPLLLSVNDRAMSKGAVLRARFLLRQRIPRTLPYSRRTSV